MPYLCKSCGNKTNFYTDDAHRDIEEYFTEYGGANLNQYGEMSDFEYNDRSEASDYNVNNEDYEPDSVKCTECDTYPEEVSQEEWDNWEEGIGEEDQDDGKPELQNINLQKLKNKLLVGETK
jgi:hypothetical protein